LCVILCVKKWTNEGVICGFPLFSFAVNTPLSTKIPDIFLMVLICMNSVVIRLIYYVTNIMCSVPEAHQSSCCNYTSLRHSLGFIIFLHFVMKMLSELKHWLCQKPIRGRVLWNNALTVWFMVRLFVILNYEIPANPKSI
jgi:ABC-type maltose transport system permease subunit